MDRRDFIGSVSLALFAQIIGTRHLLAERVTRSVGEWVDAQQHIAKSLKAGTMTGAAWQYNVEELARQIELEELLRAINFAKLERDFKFTSDGGTKQFVQLPRPDGTKLVYGAAIFGLEKNKAITPHGHRHMASAHMVISGSLHVRNYDRIADEPQHLVIRPTVDETIGVGAVSTMSSDRNNIHWFTAKTDRAFTLDVIVDSLTPNAPGYKIDLVDPRGGEKLGNGDIRARLIEWEESVRLYASEPASKP
ncbi:MAG TPA: hypothetical protein VGF48_03520 [Thermoanaerobaculia bacterium]|jgi:hypothetical protein